MSCAQDATTPTAFSEREGLTAIRRRGGMRGLSIQKKLKKSRRTEQRQGVASGEARLED